MWLVINSSPLSSSRPHQVTAVNPPVGIAHYPVSWYCATARSSDHTNCYLMFRTRQKREEEKEKTRRESWKLVRAQWERETSGIVMRTFFQMAELSFPPKGSMKKELCARAALTLASTMQNQLLEKNFFQTLERELATLPAQAWH